MPLQKWEYCTLSLAQLGPATPKEVVIRILTPNGVTTPQEYQGLRDSQTVFKAIAKLGLEGWEMVGLIADAYHFKRPISAEPSEGYTVSDRQM